MKVLADVTNYDLAIAGYPDSVGSFLIAFIEDKLKLDFNEIKDIWTLEDFEKSKRALEANDGTK